MLLETQKSPDSLLLQEFEEMIDNSSNLLLSEDFHGADFEEAVNETIIDNTPKWPNDIYQEFAKICTDYDLSNKATDAFIKFFNKYANLKISPLPKSAKEMHKFIDSMEAPNLD